MNHHPAVAHLAVVEEEEVPAMHPNLGVTDLVVAPPAPMQFGGGLEWQADAAPPKTLILP